jgi:hypothetical protein
VLEARAVLAGSGQGDRAGVVPFFFNPLFFGWEKEQKSAAVMNGCTGFWRACGTAVAGSSATI